MRTPSRQATDSHFMRYVRRIALILSISVPAIAQEPVFPVPPNVKAEGVPPIPLQLADAVSRYGEFRSGRPSRLAPDRAADARGDRVRQRAADSRGPRPRRPRARSSRSIAMASPGAPGSPRRASISCSVRTRAVAARRMQLFRFDPASGAATLLTDGKSRNGAPAFATRRGLHRLRIDAARRPQQGHLRDEPGGSRVGPDDRAARRHLGSARLVARRSASCSFSSLISSSSETYLWRMDVDDRVQKRRSRREAGVTCCGRTRASAPTARYVYALGDRGLGTASALAMRISREAAGKPVTNEGEAIEAFAESPDGTADRRRASIATR